MENNHLENFRKFWPPKSKQHDDNSSDPVEKYQTLGKYLRDVDEFGDIPEGKQDFSFGVKNYGQGLSVDGKNLVLTMITRDLKQMGQGDYEITYLLNTFSHELRNRAKNPNTMSPEVLSRLFTQALEESYGYNHGDFSKVNHSIQCLSQITARGTILTAMKFTISFELFDVSSQKEDENNEESSNLPPMNTHNQKIMNLPIANVKDFFAPAFFVFNTYIQSGEIFDDFFKITDQGIDYYGKDLDFLAYSKLVLDN